MYDTLEKDLVKLWSCMVTVMHLGNAKMMVGQYLVTCSNATALSTAEAEQINLSYAVQESIWSRKMLWDLGFVQRSPTIIY